MTKREKLNEFLRTLDGVEERYCDDGLSDDEYQEVAQEVRGFTAAMRGKDLPEDATEAFRRGYEAAAPLRALEEIVEIMYPGGDPDHEWGSEELGEIGNVLHHYGLAPEES